MSAKAADLAARYQIYHCERHHGRGCRVEACNLAREWIKIRDGSPRDTLLEEVAESLREKGASDEAVRMVRGMKTKTVLNSAAMPRDSAE